MNAIHRPKVTTARVVAAVELTRLGLQWWERSHEWWIARNAHIVTVYTDTPLYRQVRLWLTSEFDSQRSVEARAERDVHNSSSDQPFLTGTSDRRHDALALATYYDTQAPRTITVAEHQVTVTLERPGLSDRSAPVDASTLMRERVTFAARSTEGQQAVLGLFKQLIDEAAEHRPVLRSLGRWGDWIEIREATARDPSTVVLAPGQWDTLSADLDEFLDSEAEHVTRGIPWHRGYLLHGLPGCGKTSTVLALATSHNLDVWSLSLSEITADTDLVNAMSQITPGSVMLLEDVDVFHAATSRDDDNKGLSMAGLLNALDGVATPHGLITVMTTNHRDRLDPALTRSGRVDREFELAPTDHHGAWTLCCRFHPDVLDGPTPLPPGTYLQSDVVNVLREHLREPKLVATAVGQLVEMRL